MSTTMRLLLARSPSTIPMCVINGARRRAFSNFCYDSAESESEFQWPIEKPKMMKESEMTKKKKKKKKKKKEKETEEEKATLSKELFKRPHEEFVDKLKEGKERSSKTKELVTNDSETKGNPFSDLRDLFRSTKESNIRKVYGLTIIEFREGTTESDIKKMISESWERMKEEDERIEETEEKIGGFRGWTINPPPPGTLSKELFKRPHEEFVDKLKERKERSSKTKELVTNDSETEGNSFKSKKELEREETKMNFPKYNDSETKRNLCSDYGGSFNSMRFVEYVLRKENNKSMNGSEIEKINESEMKKKNIEPPPPATNLFVKSDQIAGASGVEHKYSMTKCVEAYRSIGDGFTRQEDLKVYDLFKVKDNRDFFLGLEEWKRALWLRNMFTKK